MHYISVENLNLILPSPASALAAGGDILAGTAPSAPSPTLPPPSAALALSWPLAPLAGVDLAEEGLTAPVEPSFFAAAAAAPPFEPPFSLRVGNAWSS